MRDKAKKAKEYLGKLGRSKKIWYCCFFVFSLIWLEMVLRAVTVKPFWSPNIFLIILLSIPVALLTVVVSSLCKKRINTVISCVILCIFTLLIIVQVVYYSIFSAYFTLYSLTGAGKVLGEFWRSGLNGLAKSWLAVVLCMVPLVFWLIVARKWVFTAALSVNRGVALIFLAGVIQISAWVSIFTADNGVMSKEYLYNQAFVPKLSVSNFGVLTTYRLDIKNLIGVMEPVTGAVTEKEDKDEDSEYAANALEIDFAGLMANETNAIVQDMHQYFSGLTPTRKNEYTGKYEGKNLIWICAEGFSSWALDRGKTPTLYKLAHEGYVFENFYNPIWGVSTSDGEYTTCTGLIPKAGVWSFYESGSNYMPFCLGNQLKKQDYAVNAYHDHSYSYYRRDVSHPNMGYNYKGLGQGLAMTVTWPESDVEMMELTVPEYVEDSPFHTYYMTVSGHLEYNFGGNAMAKKHQGEVADLPYSQACQAYIACNMEFDLAIANLMEQLEAAGELDNTLIVISGDHYPYGLEISEIEELNHGPVEETFELYRSTLIMWDNTMAEPVTVEKPCSPIDILPTISNLMALPYDSRLVMGKDIFSESEGLVVFSDHSWITSQGRYNAGTNTFTANKGITVPDDYAAGIMAKVNNMFTYSAKILEEDYYAKVITEDTLNKSVEEQSNQIREEEAKEKDEAGKNFNFSFPGGMNNNSAQEKNSLPMLP